MKNFIQRTITAIFFVVILLSSIYFQADYKTLTTLFILVTGLGLQEFYALVNKGFKVQTPTTYLMFCGLLLYCLIGSTNEEPIIPLTIAALYIVSFIFCILCHYCFVNNFIDIIRIIRIFRLCNNDPDYLEQYDKYTGNDHYKDNSRL